MRHTRLSAFGAAMGLLLATGSVNAAVVQWDFFGKGGWDAPPGPNSCVATPRSTNNCNLGTTASYTESGYTISFAGFTDGGASPDVATAIVENNRGSSDMGLGVLGGNDEVDLNQYIQIDLGAAYASLTNWMVMFDSIDGTEQSWLGTQQHIGNLLVTTTGQTWLAFTPMSQVIYFSTGGPGSSEDTLLKALKAETRAVPEPASIALLGFGLAGFGFRRRRAARLR